MSASSGPGQPTRKGIWMFPSAPAGELLDAIVAAEELGLDEVWLADEGVAREPVAVLAAAAGRTRRVRLAVGVTSPVLRHPGAIAASLATLDELSHGRGVLGVGVGGALALEPFGLGAERPVGLLREAIQTARSVFAREPGPGYRPPQHAMPARPVPIWVGARGPQLVRATAPIADGLFVSGCTPAEHDTIAEVFSAAGGTSLAVYQSAANRPTTGSDHSWESVHESLAAEQERLRPAAIGINLVDLVPGDHDTTPDVVGLVERAASVLAAL